MPNRDATFDQFFSSGEHHLTPDERAALQKQYGDPNSPARQELDYILNGNGMAGVIADNKSVFNKLASIDYQHLFGETIQEGLKKLAIPFALLVFTYMALLQINNNFSPGDRADMSLIHKQPDKSHIITIEKPNEPSNKKIHHKNKKNMENINSSYKNYISSALPKNFDSNETAPPISVEEKQLHWEVFNFSGHSTPQYADNIYISAISDSVNYPDTQDTINGVPGKYKCYWIFGDGVFTHTDRPAADTVLFYYTVPYTLSRKNYDTTRIKLLSACSSQSSHTGYDEVLNLSRLSHPDSASRFKFISRTWEFYPRNQSNLVESFDFKVRDKFFIERSNSIRSFINIDSALEKHSNPEVFYGIHRFSYQVSNHLKTSIYIKSGDRISLSASGAVELSDFPKACGPTGVPEQPGTLQVPVPSSTTTIPLYKHGALLYRIGENGNWKAYDPLATTIQSELEGYLEFMINDRISADNKSSYQVEVRVSGKE